MRYDKHGQDSMDLDMEMDMDMEEGEQEIMKMVDVNSTAGVLPINLIQLGYKRWNRVGRTIVMRRLQLVLVATIAAPVQSVMVIYDRQPNGSLPAASTIFSGYTQTGGTLGASTSMVNPDLVGRFEIVWDSNKDMTVVQALQVNFATSSGASQQVRVIIPLCGRIAQYQADSSPAVIGDIVSGALYLYSNTSLYYARLEYVD